MAKPLSRMSDRILDGQIKAQEQKAVKGMGDEKYLEELKEELKRRKEG